MKNFGRRISSELVLVVYFSFNILHANDYSACLCNRRLKGKPEEIGLVATVFLFHLFYVDHSQENG